MAYSILDAELVRQFPIPRVPLRSDTKVLKHETPTWSDLTKVVDACSGFGELAHGAQAVGFHSGN